MLSTSFNRKFTDKKLFILTQSVSADLHNGFLFIAELVLQQHNFFMWHSIEKLTKSNIKVFTIKTDALTIKK
jgi:hypothetical protein